MILSKTVPLELPRRLSHMPHTRSRCTGIILSLEESVRGTQDGCGTVWNSPSWLNYTKGCHRPYTWNGCRDTSPISSSLYWFDRRRKAFGIAHARLADGGPCRRKWEPLELHCEQFDKAGQTVCEVDFRSSHLVLVWHVTVPQPEEIHPGAAEREN